MPTKLLQENSYKDLTSKHVKEVITYLNDNKYEFNLTANITAVKFNPELPEKISALFTQYTLFTLANYTYSSLVIKEDYIEFEAGFGAENFGSVCTIPYFGIFQLGMNDSILFINPIATMESHFIENLEVKIQEQRSRNAFKSLNKEE